MDNSSHAGGSVLRCGVWINGLRIVSLNTIHYHAILHNPNKADREPWHRLLEIEKAVSTSEF